MKCQLCGFEFIPDAACHAACPMSASCSVICCPNCGYQTVDESRSAVIGLLRKASSYLPKRSPARGGRT